MYSEKTKKLNHFPTTKSSLKIMRSTKLSSTMPQRKITPNNRMPIWEIQTILLRRRTLSISSEALTKWKNYLLWLYSRESKLTGTSITLSNSWVTSWKPIKFPLTHPVTKIKWKLLLFFLPFTLTVKMPQLLTLNKSSGRTAKERAVRKTVSILTHTIRSNKILSYRKAISNNISNNTKDWSLPEDKATAGLKKSKWKLLKN